MTDVPGFRIRAAEQRDLPRLAPLEQRAGERFRESAHPYAADLPSFDPDELARLQGSGSVWVAVDERDEPVGFAIAGWLGPLAYLHELDVDLAFGRRGLGRALVRRVAVWAGELGCDRLWLSTFVDVPYNAPFYARLGFEIVPLHAYDDVLSAQRARDAAQGLRLDSRVIMCAPLTALLGRTPE